MQKVSFSQKALSDLQKLFIYLDENWPEKVRMDFQEKFLQTMEILQKTPGIFPQSDLKKVHKAVVTKHNSILYLFTEKEIRILRVFDNRLHPQKRKK